MAWAIREHIEIASEAGRLEPRITGHRIRVQDVVIWYEKLGMSADEIVHNYPTITLSDVYAALAYYWDHRDDIERAIADEKALAEEFRRDQQDAGIAYCERQRNPSRGSRTPNRLLRGS